VALFGFGSSRKARAKDRRKKESLKQRAFKPQMEHLETRLTPAGAVLQFHIAPQSGTAFGGTDLLVAEPTVGSSNLVVTVDRTGDISGPSSVDFTTADETAAAGVQYTATSGTLNFAAGQASATFNVPILHTLPSPDGSLSGPKVFGLALSNASAGDSINVLGDQSAVTVRDTNGTHNQRFVNDVFFELLNRNADPGAIQFFGAQLQAGLSTAQVVNNIESSVVNGHNEYLDNTVNRLFQSFLGRNADPGALVAFGNEITAGASLQTVQSQIMGSDEYFTNAGSTNVGFVSQAYRDLVGRNPDAGGLTFWTNQLGTPSTIAQRTTMIANMLVQTEVVQDILKNYYTIYLNRLPDTGGFTFYTNQLTGFGQPVQSLKTVVNEFLTSTTEYFNGC